MTRDKRFALLAAVLTLSAMSSGALAQDRGWLAGVSYGASNADQACDGIPVSCDKRDTGWKVFGGYQFNPNLAVELAYVGLGKVTANGVIGGVPVNAEAEGEGWEVSVVGKFPFSQTFSILGRIGAFHWEVDATATAGVPALARVTANANGTDLTYGLGLEYNFSRTISGRLEWQRFNSVGDTSTTGGSDVDLFTVGVAVRF